MDSNVETTNIYSHPELLVVADTVAREKGIDREEVLEAMEQAIQKAGRSKYGHEHDIRAEIDRNSGEIKLARYLEVAEEIENEMTQVTLDTARGHKDDAVLGEFLVYPLPPIDFGRIAAQTAKQVIVQKVREAEKSRQYDDFKDKQSQILSGIIKRTEYGNVIVDLGRTEAIIQKNELIPRENIKAGDRIKAYCYDVRREQRGQQIFLSRANPKFMEKLFVQEVPEIYDGLIEIKSSSRDPGSRAKICVKAIDTSLDPVGACVGMRGSRIQSIVRELNGEKIDIINFSDQPEILLTRAIAPAKPLNMLLDEKQSYAVIVFEDDELAVAIGRNGQNISLASDVTGFTIDAISKSDYNKQHGIVDENHLSTISGFSAPQLELLSDIDAVSYTHLTLPTNREV